MDWFRNTTWTDEIASLFEAKLRRARKKEQYLRIQASILTESHPDVSHALLDRYFTLPDQFDAAWAHVARACAFLAQSKVDDAIAAYECALTREAEFPNLRSRAYIELPYLIATREIQQHYSRAIDILNEHTQEPLFPVDHFQWNAAYALITQARGLGDAPYRYAKAAMDAATEDHSGARYHPSVGLVPASFTEVRERLRRMCDP